MGICLRAMAIHLRTGTLIDRNMNTWINYH